MFYYLFISLIGSSWSYSACAIMVKLQGVGKLRVSSSVTPKFCKISWMICIAWRSLLSFSQCKDIG